MMYGFGEHGWGMGWGWIIGLAVLVLIIWLLVKVTSQNNSQKQSGSKSALDILKERYAKGEISKEEYKEKKNDIL
jgi:putative membrane protein